jgi:hypothetical protein
MIERAGSEAKLAFKAHSHTLRHALAFEQYAQRFAENGRPSNNFLLSSFAASA